MILQAGEEFTSFVVESFALETAVLLRITLHLETGAPLREGTVGWKES